MRGTLEERFWAKVQRGTVAECWVWKASKDDKGYGTVWDGTKVVKTHRLSWEMHRGAVPGELCVCHRCDNPSCVNPHHMFLGTVADNNLDKEAKGRAGHPRGSKHGLSKLDEAKVSEIRRRLAAGETQVALAREFGVEQPVISKIKLRRIWRHVA